MTPEEMAGRDIVIVQGYGRPVYVELYEGLIRDNVRAWVDIRPALGGSLGSRSVWRGKGRQLRDDMVRDLAAKVTP